MKSYINATLVIFSLFPGILPAQDIVFSYQVETVSNTESRVKVFAREDNGGTENLVGFTVDFYYDNTESTLTSFNYAPLTALGWAVNQSQLLHDPTTNPAVPITHTGFGTTNVFDDNFTGTSIGATPVHVLTLNFDHSTGTAAASEGFLASTVNNRPALAYTEFDGNNFHEHPVVVTGQQAQALPVELLFFRAFKSGEASRLEWATASEFNAGYFEIQHSADGIFFKKIGRVQAAGFSTTEQRYDFLHETPVNGVNYYRLKQHDLDGSFDYSNVVSLSFSSLGDWQHLVQVYPNPASDFIFLEIPETEDLNAELADNFGRIVSTKKGTGEIDVSALTPGMYFLKIAGKQANEFFVVPVSVIR